MSRLAFWKVSEVSGHWWLITCRAGLAHEVYLMKMYYCICICIYIPLVLVTAKPLFSFLFFFFWNFSNQVTPKREEGTGVGDRPYPCFYMLIGLPGENSWFYLLRTPPIGRKRKQRKPKRPCTRGITTVSTQLKPCKLSQTRDMLLRNMSS